MEEKNSRRVVGAIIDGGVVQECKTLAQTYGVAYNTVIEAFLLLCIKDHNSARVKLAIERIHEKNTQRLSEINSGNAAQRYKEKS